MLFLEISKDNWVALQSLRIFCVLSVIPKECTCDHWKHFQMLLWGCLEHYVILLHRTPNIEPIIVAEVCHTDFIINKRSTSHRNQEEKWKNFFC